MTESPRCAVHPDAAALGPCERCGTFICPACKGTVERLLCTKCQARLNETPIPWEVRKTPVTFLATVWNIVRNPAAFGRRLDPNGDLGSPIAYVLACTLVANLVLAGRGLFGHVVPLTEAIQNAASLAAILMGLTLCVFAVAASLIHVAGRLFGAHGLRFTATARVVGYAATPLLLMPAFSFDATAAWGFLLMLAGLALAHIGLVHSCSARPKRAFAAVFGAPFLLSPCCFFAFYNFFSRVSD